MEKDRICKNCKYWKVWDDRSGFPTTQDPMMRESLKSILVLMKNSGECRRYPPKINPDGNSEFPKLNGDDFCGEFKIKDE